MRLYFIGICAYLFLSISLVCAEVNFADGKYSVSIAFSQNVPSEKGTNVIGQLKESLQDASKILHNAIGMQFSKVMVEVPESWNTSEWSETVDLNPNSFFTTVDILIDNTEDTVFGKFPFAQQYGSCGIPGYQMIVPAIFFVDERNSFPKGLSIAREWLKYRYGVFDENGYLNDPSYPLYYNIPGSNDNKVHITDCTNIEIPYNFTVKDGGDECPSDKMLIDKLKHGECEFRINEDAKENVTSSFMYFDESLSSMTHICGKDDHQHNSRSPNKQNVLCYGESIWDTLSKSSDFSKGEQTIEYKEAEFVFFKKTKPRVVVAWENTQKMKNKGEVILKAISKLMIDLPDGSKFSAFPFTDSILDKDYALADLADLRERTLVNSGITSNFDRNVDGNYKTAIKKAVEILQTAAGDGEKPQGSIIILTATSFELIVILLKDVNVCSPLDASIEHLISENKYAVPCSEMIEFPMAEEPENIFKMLTESMGIFSPSKVEDKFTETLKIEYLRNGTALSVEVDDWTETLTFWVFRELDSENFLLQLNGKEKKPTKDETYGKVQKLSYSDIQAGVWEFSYKYSMDTSLLVHVEKTSKAGKYVTGEVIVQDTTKTADDSQMPVIIYTIVRFGSYPVQNANVSATITHPGGEETYLVLNDDGKGDPDITKNDGVYSRYFTNFTEKGEYTVKVSVFNGDNTAAYAVDENAGYKSCCGSIVSGNAQQLSYFRKVLKGKFTAKSGRPEEGYKPSRITDLRVGSVEEDGITLTWTAPGAEADSGTVQSYEIKSFTSEDDVKNKFDSGVDIFNDTYSPKERGETEVIKIRYDAFEKNGVHYIAMKAKNSDQISDISAIVEVNINTNRETTDTPDEDKQINIGKSNPQTIGLIVGLIVGLILLMIIIYVVIYFVIVKPKRKKERKEQQKKEQQKKERTENPVYETSQRTESNAMNPISFVSADTLIKHHNERVKAKTENKELPIFKEKDFEDRNFKPANESDTSSNDQDREYGNKNPRNGLPLAPKSPKRITPV